MKKINFLTLAEKALSIAEDKKGENVLLLDVTGLTELANYFVIVSANSTPQINAISSEIEKTLKYDFGVPVIRRDGIASANWKVLDFGGLIVHIMNPSVREQYNLEKIWAQTEKTEKKDRNVSVKKQSVKRRTGKKTTVKKTTKKVVSKKIKK
ncbi:MAG: ribosome silencing factor [Endomicrobiaceae bacterium]|jgi:ribosome-associated protein|nr:ribosome silencing factor [Endomicrobiaceae bacterium]